MKNVYITLKINAGSGTEMDLGSINLPSERLFEALVDVVPPGQLLHAFKIRLMENAMRTDQSQNTRMDNERDLRDFLNLMKDI